MKLVYWEREGIEMIGEIAKKFVSFLRIERKSMSLQKDFSLLLLVHLFSFSIAIVVKSKSWRFVFKNSKVKNKTSVVSLSFLEKLLLESGPQQGSSVGSNISLFNLMQRSIWPSIHVCLSLFFFPAPSTQPALLIGLLGLLIC